ncbi:hypothetical protein KR044_010751, partial [Drosophila immigrans]
MRVLQIVILTLIAVCPDDVLSAKGDKKKNLGPCGKQYMRQISGKCYYFAAKKMNWFGAQNNCLRKGLNLANLASKDDLDAVIRFLASKGNMEDFWFGGNDLQTEGRFTYISNGLPVQFNGVDPTQRSNFDDCLELRLRENTTTITDENCSEQQYFICEDNAQKCAQPVMVSSSGGRHSHEHLHHFHHNPAKDETVEGSEESVESDSRPADNSNSTEDTRALESEEETEDDNETEVMEIQNDKGNPGDEAAIDAARATTAGQLEATSPPAEDSTTAAAEAEPATTATEATTAAEAGGGETTTSEATGTEAAVSAGEGGEATTPAEAS